MPFGYKDIPDLSSKVILITGGNAGLGYQSALEMARKNARIILLCRSEEKAKISIEKIIKDTGNSKVEFVSLDLCSLDSVKKCADKIREMKIPIHVLLNNAGMAFRKFKVTGDGYNELFQSNHLGHFYLTNLLLDIIEDSAPSRIVNVSSAAHFTTFKNGILSQEEMLDPKVAVGFTFYGMTKLCNVLFTKSLTKRLKDKKVYCNCLHPGFVGTDIGYNVDSAPAWLKNIVIPVVNVFARSPEQGALSQVYLSTSNDVETKDIRGEYFDASPEKLLPLKGFAVDDDLAEKLWEMSEKMVQKK